MYVPGRRLVLAIHPHHRDAERHGRPNIVEYALSDVQLPVALANRYLDAYTVGELDRVDVVYTRFISTARQQAVAETLLPLESLKIN